MSHISIIGTPGAGKTVFLSVLATKFRRPLKNRPWLEFRNRETETYVMEAWDTLQASDWPSSTQSGTFPRLEWVLHTRSGKNHNVSVRDAVGQDFSTIYNSGETLTPEQEQLKATLESSAIILFLVNLREIIDAVSRRQVAEIEVPLKLAMDDALQRQARVAVILTQHDSFRDYLKSAFDGPGDDPRHVLAEFLPQLAGLMQSHPAAVSAFFVASVADTVPVEEHGKVYMRPRRNFGSEGLDEVLDWIEDVVPQVHADAEAAERLRKQAEQAAESARQAQAAQSLVAQFKKRRLQEGVAWSIVTLIIAFFAGHAYESSVYSDLNQKSVKTEHYQQPRSVEYETTERQTFDPLAGKYYDVYRQSGEVGGLDDFTFTNETSSTLYNLKVVITSPGVSSWFTADEVPPYGSCKASQLVNTHYDHFSAYVTCKADVQVKKEKTVYDDEERIVHDDSKDEANRSNAADDGNGLGFIILLCGLAGIWLRLRALKENYLKNTGPAR